MRRAAFPEVRNEVAHLPTDGVPNGAHTRHDLLVGAGEGRGIGKRPVELLGTAGENGTSIRGLRRTDGNDVAVGPAGFEKLEDVLGFFPGDAAPGRRRG